MFCTASKTFVNLSFTLLFVFLATFTSSPTMISQLRSNFLLQYISSNQRKVPPIDYWLFSLSVIVGIIQQSIFVLVVLFCFVSHHKDHWAIAIFVTYVRLFRPGIVYNDAAFCCPDPKCPPCESFIFCLFTFKGHRTSASFWQRFAWCQSDLYDLFICNIIYRKDLSWCITLFCS